MRSLPVRLLTKVGDQKYCTNLVFLVGCGVPYLCGKNGERKHLLLWNPKNKNYQFSKSIQNINPTEKIRNRPRNIKSQYMRERIGCISFCNDDDDDESKYN